LTCDGIRGAETSLAKVNPDALLMTYQINAMGPILVTKVGIYVCTFCILFLRALLSSDCITILNIVVKETKTDDVREGIMQSA
jgi:hypothetical protein